MSHEEAGMLAAGPRRVLGLGEGSVGVTSLPLGIVPNLILNGRDVLVPYATEEASVVAGASRVALLLREHGGVTAGGGERLLGAQILVEGGDPDAWIEARGEELRRRIQAGHPSLAAAGGGLRRLVVSRGAAGAVIRLEAGVGDAQGAHALDRMAEEVARAWVDEVPGARALAAIVTNWPIGACAWAKASLPLEALARRTIPGDRVGRDIERLSRWAETDPIRRVTHLKGAMNGILGVMAAFQQDLRAISSSVHAGVWGGLPGIRGPAWRIEGGRLHGTVALPVPCGVVGRGQDDPVLGLLRRLAGVRRGTDLEALAVAAGLVQNLAALQVIVTEGIVEGHGRLHASREAGP
ncbi:MAG: hypothetical protein FJ098_13050 [Deltaproteobacteria bacterium]|nr:hypothetical protein [Deltaproteobacteria bacterium]